MRHVALFVDNFKATEDFYTDIMGMSVEWRPDENNVYLTSGNDNLALHKTESIQGTGRLDHIGFFIDDGEEIGPWYEYLKGQGVQVLTEPRTHRDGARSFYCRDPSGTRVQIIYHPPISSGTPSGCQ